MRPVKRAAVWCLAVAAALLAGCGTLPERVPVAPDPAATPEAAWEAHARALSRFRSWTMLATLAVRSGGDASRVTMRWRQTRDAYLVRFIGPLGVGLLEVEGSAAGVEARFPGGRRAGAASPEALLEREIGWSVPLQGLRYWIVGAPAPGGEPSRMALDGQGRLARLEQGGWTVVYERYGRLRGPGGSGDPGDSGSSANPGDPSDPGGPGDPGGLDGLALPERIRFSSETVDATVVVRRWTAADDPV